MIKNIYSAKAQLIAAHNGKNQVQLSRVLDQKVDGSRLIFLDYVVIPPGASIGLHKHQELEEIYILISGKGKMVLDKDTWRVKPGDVILITVGTDHELSNDRKAEIHLLVCAVAQSTP